MADITKNDVTNCATELATSTVPSAATWASIIRYVNRFDLTKTGEDVDTDYEAKVNLAAHMATMNKRASASTAGPVTGESSGNVRRSYGLIATATEMASLSSTRYGQRYLEIMGMSLAAGPMLI